MSNSNQNNSKKENIEIEKNANHPWHWIDEKFCFPQQNYCIDRFYFHFDSLSDKITMENIDNYIPDSITRVFRINNIYMVDINKENNKVLPQFIKMYNVISFLKNNKYKRFNKTVKKNMYVDTFPVKLSYFYSLNNKLPMIIKDTFKLKNSAREIGDSEIKTIGELKIIKYRDDYLRNIEIKMNLDGVDNQNTYFIHNSNNSLEIELRIKPFDKTTYLRIN